METEARERVGCDVRGTGKESRNQGRKKGRKKGVCERSYLRIQYIMKQLMRMEA